MEPSPAERGARSARELEAELDRLLDPVLSSRRTAQPLAHAMALFSREQQDIVLRWAAIVARTNIELAFQFVAVAPQALAACGTPEGEAWLIEVMDTYDREGLYPATELLTLSPSTRAAFALTAVKLVDVAQVLQRIVNGLSGRRMRIEAASETYTDTEVLYLPSSIARGHGPDQNFLLYKATAVLLWAQTRHGTFNVDLARVCLDFADAGRALDLLCRLETLRLEARIARELPGLGRAMAALRKQRPDPCCAPLLQESATVLSSVAVLHDTYALDLYLEDPYAIVLRPARATARRAVRIERQKSDVRSALSALENGAATAAKTPYSLQACEAPSGGAGVRYLLHRDGRQVAMPPELEHLIDSVVQDLGSVPDDYLIPAGPGADDGAAGDGTLTALESDVGAEVFCYDEWDHVRGHYRRNWCVLRERDSPPARDDFIAQTLAKYAGTIRQLRRTFELMRTDDRVLKRQPDGDGIDLDALLEARADMKAGAELGPLLFTRRSKDERNLAVMFMVDMSGSTKGWVNEAEREALLMLCEALEVLGDRYAIYGFSGMTRKRCEVFRIKRFDEPYGELVHQRIAGIRPQDYTRMGAAIRHLSALLNRVQSRTKLLVTLSDGKPDDYSDEYRGEYGIEDTRHALLEAHHAGIKAFCITIDDEAREYLPHMYGAANWTLIADVAALPLKVAEIYHRITR